LGALGGGGDDGVLEDGEAGGEGSAEDAGAAGTGIAARAGDGSTLSGESGSVGRVDASRARPRVGLGASRRGEAGKSSQDAGDVGV
jgi:hypothetical protein